MRFKTLLLLVALLYVPDRDRLKLSVYEGQNTKITEQMNVSNKIAEIPQHKRDFLNILVPLVEQHYTGMFVKRSVVLAQAALESGWMIKYPTLTNNIFGIYYGGKFANFETISSCVKAHRSILAGDRYRDVRFSKTWQEQCDQLLKCGYAEDPNYSKKLKSIIKTNKLWQYDN